LETSAAGEEATATTTTTTITNSPLASYLYALDSPATRHQYPKRLKIFLNFAVGMPGKTVEEQAAAFLAKKQNNSDNNNNYFYRDVLISFITYNKERVLRKEFSAGSLNTYYQNIKLFYEMNDITEGINWRKISRGLPKARTVSNDRAPTLEELRKLMEYADRRIKMLVTVMFSSGIRVGAWEYLQLKHVIPVKNNCAKLIVYDDELEQYYTFITPEAHAAIKEWIAYRESYGEKITPDSYLFRDLWPTTTNEPTYGGKNAVGSGTKKGLATYPKKLKTAAVQKNLSRALWKQGIRQPLKKGARRHPFKLAHGLRKAFRSKAGQVMKHLNVELIMGHKTTGTQETYWRPTEEEVLEDYLKAVDLLTINATPSKLTETAILHEAETMKQKLEQMESRQSAIERIFKKFIADEQDWNPQNPEENKRIEETFQRIMNIKSKFFGE
jgi:integrase